MTNCALKELIKIVGTQQKLAELLGPEYSQQRISHWLRSRIPAEEVSKLVKIGAGQFKASDFRPDLFDGILNSKD